ncbi:MAG: OmpA family protein [Spirochaetia bacterium]|nr:OmpA family protein [Spirochaetia bacterium]
MKITPHKNNFAIIKIIKKDIFFKFFYLVFLLFHASLFAIEFNPLEKLNSQYNEFSPSISPDGKFLLFSSKRNNDKYMHIYISQFNHGIWSTPVKFDALNSLYNDESPFISRDGTIIVFASDRDGSRPFKSGAVEIVSFDIYWSHLKNGRWSIPEILPGAVNSPYHEKAPSLSNDNRTVYFTRWPPNQIQKSKIMYADFSGSKFNQPAPMPAEINSGNMEAALIPDQKGTGFYFSSRREGGFGGWDIYFISYRNGEYGLPVNLGDSINSKFDEAFFSVLNGRIYYCSSSPGNGKDFDILEAFLPGQKEILINVSDLNDFPVRTNIEFNNIFEKRMPEILHKETSDQGSLSFPLDDDIGSIDIFIEKEGYLPYYKKIEKKELLNPRFNLVLTPIKNNATFSIEDIYFDYEKSEIKKESLPFLLRLVSFLQKNPMIDIDIIGHTDMHGEDAYNLELSKNRALAVKKFLEDSGINSRRLNSSGVGKSDPLIDEINSHADKLNRRTEFKIREIIN